MKKKKKYVLGDVQADSVYKDLEAAKDAAKGKGKGACQGTHGGIGRWDIGVSVAAPWQFCSSAGADTLDPRLPRSIHRLDG